MTDSDDYTSLRPVREARITPVIGCGCWVELRHVEPAHCAGLRSHFEESHPDQMDVFESAVARRMPKVPGVAPSGLSQGELQYRRAMRRLGTPLPDPVSFRTPERHASGFNEGDWLNDFVIRHDWLIPIIFIAGAVTAMLLLDALGIRRAACGIIPIGPHGTWQCG